MRKKGFFLSIAFLLALPLCAERRMVDCQNIAVNGGESPKWVSLLFEKHNEKKARKELEIGKDEKLFYQKAESESLEFAKSLVRQSIYRDALAGKENAVLNALHTVAEFWILEEDSETKSRVYTFYAVYAMP